MLAAILITDGVITMVPRIAAAVGGAQAFEFAADNRSVWFLKWPRDPGAVSL